MDGPWYARLFNDAYMAHLVEMPETRTQAEVDFLEAKLAARRGERVLDLCCGTGRHAVEFAARGYRVSGIDLNPNYLAVGAGWAGARGVEVEFINSDMREVGQPGTFAACYNWYSSFGYFGADSQDAAVLRSVFDCLIPGGRFAIDILNVAYFLNKIVPYDWRPLPDGSIMLEELAYDLYTGQSRFRVTRVTAAGERLSDEVAIRLYSLVELRGMLEAAGFRVIDFWGGPDGSRCQLSSQRCIALAVKPDAGR